MTVQLKRIVYAQDGNAAANAEEFAIVALSPGLTTQDSSLWRGLVSLQPLSAANEYGSQAYGLFAGPGGGFVFAGARLRGGDPSLPLHDYLLVPHAVLRALEGNLIPLVEIVNAPLPPEVLQDKHVSPALLAQTPAWSPEERCALLDELLTSIASHGDENPLSLALALLAAALHERGLMIVGFPGNGIQRVRLVQGLMALLPASVRAEFTFSTNRRDKMTTHARVVFTDTAVTTGRWVCSWESGTFPLPAIEEMSYVKRLHNLKDSDPAAMLALIDSMDALSRQLDEEKTLTSRLLALAERHALNEAIETGQPIAPEALKTTFRHLAPGDRLYAAYAERLLEYALASRDADAALLAAAVIDAGGAPSERLQAKLDTALRSEPDAVYAFIRARLNVDLDERWLQRLQVAALASLHIAIHDADTKTALDWLRLIAREPAAYGLQDIVFNGILAAQQRPTIDETLARGLLALAARRSPRAVEPLLANEALVSALPPALKTMLLDHEGDAPSLLETCGPELLLIALANAAAARKPALFGPPIIEQLWKLFISGSQNSANNPYSAEQIVQRWAAEGAGWLNDEALATLLRLTVADHRDDLFMQLVRQLHDHPNFRQLSLSALAGAGRAVSDLLALIAGLVAAGDFTPQDAVDAYIYLLDEAGWDVAFQPMMAQLARAAAQAALHVPRPALWSLISIGAGLKDELLARAAGRRLLSTLEDEQDDDAITETLQELLPLLSWSSAARGVLLSWWRRYVRTQPIARLQRFDKAFEGKKSLEELRSIVQSLIAFRRTLGKRSLAQFAEDINAAFAVLQALSEAFDPAPRRALRFDPHIIRDELDARLEELSPHQLKILANNLKDLADLIATMGDSRSKSSVLRRGEDITHQLLTGEQEPHSAVDTLKWMGGYLSGAHNRSETKDERSSSA